MVEVPEIVRGIVTSFECAALIVAVIIAIPPFSAIVVSSKTMLVTLGSELELIVIVPTIPE